MKPAELSKPTVPISYVHLTLELARERGIGRAALLQGLHIPETLLTQADARLGLMLYGRMCIHALQLTREPALGYEFGLRTNLTAHGIVGLGLMCQPTVREMFAFATRYMPPLCMPGWDARLEVDGDQAVVQVFETVPYGVLRQYALDMLMAALATTIRPFLPARPEMELRFDCKQPDYYPRYRRRLPTARFEAGANQLRLPLKYLDRPIASANASTARLVAQMCERERVLLGGTDDLLGRIRSALTQGPHPYPGLTRMAATLHLTPRTLRRRLQEQGASYQQLLDEARYRGAVRLLEDPTLTLADIAVRLRFSTASNFSRAFIGWSGMLPGTYRRKKALGLKRD